MNADQIPTLISRYQALSDQEKVACLASLSHALTVDARYYVSERPSIEKLSVINELQHQISSMIGHLSVKDDKRYPDDVFVRILFDKAEPTFIGKRLVDAIARIEDRQP